jgi:hypothetical protein
MAKTTRLKPAPVKYPNGGGLKSALAKANPRVVATQKEVLKAKHKADKVKFEEKYGPQDWSE